jgi:hypothetical protein
MQRRVAAYFSLACSFFPVSLLATSMAAAADLPEIKISTSNRVPECATPGRMMRYLRSRNAELDARYAGIATEYMRLGETLGVRWDYAFYQMIVETGSLSYRRGNRAGDVKSTQNNFAGLGATGGGVPGESFKDIATGVRAHLEHLLLYAGDRLQNPTAERTRKVQEWGVLTEWHAHFHRPITFADLAQQWAPGSHSYPRMLEEIADHFAEFCAGPDPQPELVAEARGRTAEAVAEAREASPKLGAELARRAIADGKAEDNAQRSALGALEPERPQPMPFTLLNAPAAPEADAPTDRQTDRQQVDRQQDGAARGETAVKAYERTPGTAEAREPGRTSTGKAVSNDKGQFRTASVAGVAATLPPPTPPTGGQKCRVWTASYGGQKALIIRSIADKVVNYTVLDVNDGAEKREAEAFISAYAKDGSVTGEFTSQTQALDKAFELCPEG